MSKADVRIVNFFVFNPAYGSKEGEEYKKLLYFHPSSATLDSKIKVIGLSEAIINFMETFTNSPCESLHTQKTKQLYYKPEDSFWIVMTINIPTTERFIENKVKIEYMDDHIIDKTYQAVLERSYKTFKMFNGSISHILSKGDINSLKQRLEHFFNKYLPMLRISDSNILDVFNGIHYLPLDRNIYLKVQSFVNRMESTFSGIKHSMVLYNYQLVWSGVEQEDLRILYAFLLTNLYPAMMEQDFQASSFEDNISRSSSFLPGKFILGPPNIRKESNMGQVPQVHLSGRNGDVCHLVVYRLYDAVVALLLDCDTKLPFTIFENLDDYFHENLQPLATEFAEQKVKRLAVLHMESSIKYVYFNRANAAQKSSMHTLDGIVLGANPDVMRIISNLNIELNNEEIPVEDCETVIKMANDCWIVAKKSDKREIYIVVNQKNANLIEINDEVKKLCTSHFSNIFFLD